MHRMIIIYEYTGSRGEYIKKQPKIVKILKSSHRTMSQLRSRSNFKFVLTIVMCVELMIAILSPDAALAQGTFLSWSYPVKIHEQDSELDQPALVGDRSGLLHLFWSELPRTDRKSVV